MTDIDELYKWLICYDRHDWYVYDCYDACNINQMIRTLRLLFMSCYDVYDMLHGMDECSVKFIC